MKSYIIHHEHISFLFNWLTVTFQKCDIFTVPWLIFKTPWDKFIFDIHHCCHGNQVNTLWSRQHPTYKEKPIICCVNFVWVDITPIPPPNPPLNHFMILYVPCKYTCRNVYFFKELPDHVHYINILHVNSYGIYHTQLNHALSKVQEMDNFYVL